MPDTASVDTVWRAAIEAVLADPDGEDVRCGGDVFGPVLTPGGFVVMRCWAVVSSDDPDRTRDACDAAWRRFARVDDDGAEAGPDDELDDPEPFGYPVIDGGDVILAFDAREDEAPFPHRALTCLRILVDELRRHGCTPVRLVNPLRLPDDEGVDIEALADEVPTSTRTTPARGSQAVRPSWLPPFHEVARARAGRPDGPVPFVLLAGTHVLAWDPHRGLLRLPRAETEAAAHTVSMNVESLSADGTRLRYGRQAGPGSTTPGSWGRGSVDLCSGVVSVRPAEAVEVYESHEGGPQLRSYRPAWDTAPEDRRYRFELLHGSTARDLPLPDRLVPWSRPAAQFSPSGRLLLTSHLAPDSRRYVVCTDVVTGHAREYDGAALVGTASWSPDETRVLIRRGDVHVLALDSGDEQWISDYRLGPDEPTSPDRWDALGWLGDAGVLMSLRHGRRIRLAYQPVDDRARFPVLDIPATATRSDTLGISLAPAVLRAAPELIGFHPADSRTTGRSDRRGGTVRST
jgi:hypothetical protein